MNILIENNVLDFLKVEKVTNTNNQYEDVDNISFGFTPEFYDDNLKSYDIVFHMNFNHRSGVVFEMKYRAQFVTDDDITDEFKKSHFIFVNSPAIAYPFLRACVANIMLLSGYDPIMLPTVNFQKMFNDKNKN